MATRSYASERLKTLLTTNRSAAYAAAFDKLLSDLVVEANDLKDYDGENASD